MAATEDSRICNDQEWKQKVDFASWDAERSRHDAEIAVKEMGRLGTKLGEADAEISRLKAALAKAPCAKLRMNSLDRHARKPYVPCRGNLESGGIEEPLADWCDYCFYRAEQPKPEPSNDR